MPDRPGCAAASPGPRPTSPAPSSPRCRSVRTSTCSSRATAAPSRSTAAARLSPLSPPRSIPAGPCTGERAALIGRLCRGETDLRSLRRDLPHRLDRIDGLPARLAAEFGDLGGRIEPVPWPADRNFADLAGEAGLIAVLQAGDELACDALAELAIAAGSEPAADFFYSDEIRLNP